MKRRGAVILTRPGLFLGFGPVRVVENGTPFYSFDREGAYTFTLPPGEYDIDGGAYVGDFDAPDPGDDIDLPGRLRVVFRPNPNRCSIDLKRGRIICDPSVLAYPRVCLTYILFHELGHYRWNGARTVEEAHEVECACDAFAQRQMLARGWNPSQIAAASELTLSECSHARKRRAWDHLKNVRRAK